MASLLNACLGSLPQTWPEIKNKSISLRPCMHPFVFPRKTQNSRNLKINSLSRIKPPDSFHATPSVSAVVPFVSSVSTNPASSSKKTFRIYSFSDGGKVDGSGPGVPKGSDTSGFWIRTLEKGAYLIAGLALAYTGSFGLPAHLQPFVDKIMIFPVAHNSALSIWTWLWAWLWMPKLLRAFYKDAAASLCGKQVPYEQSFCRSLEVAVRVLGSFISFSRLIMVVTPTASGPLNLVQAERVLHILCLTYCVDQWKGIFLRPTLVAQSDNEHILALSKMSSLVIYAVGSMVVAERCGIKVQSVVSVLGIGVTAFAVEHIFKNALAGLFVLFTNRFRLGDIIKVGSTEGKVVEMGLISTTLLTADESLVRVPNSSFLSQGFENKSRDLVAVDDFELSGTRHSSAVSLDD